MTNTVSEYFTDEDLISQLRLQFDDEEQWDTDFRVFFNQIETVADGYSLNIRSRTFFIDEITGEVIDLDETDELDEDEEIEDDE